jgi:hypothetical protein
MRCDRVRYIKSRSLNGPVNKTGLKLSITWHASASVGLYLGKGAYRFYDIAFVIKGAHRFDDIPIVTKGAHRFDDIPIVTNFIS